MRILDSSSTYTCRPGCFRDLHTWCSGGSSGCCVRNQPNIVQVSCGGQAGCQPGYGCGQYGCAKRRAFGGLTKRIDGVIIDEEEGDQAWLSPTAIALKAENEQGNLTVQRLTNPNFIFHSCCEARGLPDACVAHCHYNTYTADKLEAMFHKEDSCPLDTINEIHYCAAQGLDHRPCCIAEGVADTSAGDKCLAFCDQRPNRFTPIDASYLPCYDVFENMKKCFFIEIRKRAESKFSNYRIESVGGGQF
ncbi:unnamed protein product [Caenorhabditis auriculariae]|uniref:Domain of unknown function DB domain-containing protein n=1 Tax=Caenorhabditis auriculariae TaxID=2777116 RepID=A0A8S1HF01_9PELO|nr:unnamed protein product [Caenorhabditis auriculariae]